jgi:hypothetical protein
MSEWRKAMVVENVIVIEIVSVTAEASERVAESAQ